MNGHELPNVVTTILSGIVVLFLFSIGVFLHSKIILVSRKDKGMTWKFDIFNSCAVVIHYGKVIFMYGITYLVKDISSYTGDWFCYVIKFITMESNIYVLKHSLFIAAMKYVIIVQYEWVRDFGGNEKVKKIFFGLKIIYPSLVLAIFTVARPDYIFALGSISQANRCLGISDTVSNVDGNRSVSKMIHMCIYMAEPLEPSQWEYAIHIGQKVICYINTIWFYLNMWNFVEALIYVRIFSFMRR